jgi:hypothetical protein
MEPQIVESDWYEVETTAGTWFVPADLCTVDLDEEEPDLSPLQDYVEGRPMHAELRHGFGARLSAPGYMDCTEWAVFDTEDEAQAYLDENYPDEDEDA